MRVSQISVYHQPRNYTTNSRKPNCKESCPPLTQTVNPNFKGKFGAWLGAIAGGAAVVGAALITAPAIACLAGGGALVGGLGMDMIEDAINGKKKD